MDTITTMDLSQAEALFILKQREDRRELSRLRALNASSVSFSETKMTVVCTDGREFCVPIEWYQRLYYGTPEELADYEITDGYLYWPRLDASLSVYGIALGVEVRETESSLAKWRKEHGK